VQIVYLSNRPSVLAGTLRSVARCQPWVDHAVVCAPAGQHRAIEAESAPVWPHRLTLLDEEELTGLDAAAIAALGHVERNVTLRRAMVEGGHTDDTFLLSDDDYRPLTTIPLTDYVADDGRHHGFWFYALEPWPSDQTSYDQAQIRTLGVLQLLDMPTLAYGSHMPQIMTVDGWRRAFEASDSVGGGALVDEWSLYFNVGRAETPERFAEPRPFRTLAWPQWPHQWPFFVRPEPIRFENHYPEHEAPGGLFADLGTVDTDADALERIVAWRQAEVAIAELRFDPAWIDPWTKGQPHRRGAAAAIRAAAKVRKYASFTDTDR